MRHLKSIFESNIEEEISNLCKDIITDLKDDYPNIECEIFNDKSEKYMWIEINPNYGLDTHSHQIDFIENKLKFLNKLLNYCKTIEKSINKNIKIANYFDEDDTNRKIIIYFDK